MRVHEGALNDAINYAQKGCAVQMSGMTLSIPPGIPRAFDVFSGGREFDELSLPRGGAFDHYS